MKVLHVVLLIVLLCIVGYSARFYTPFIRSLFAGCSHCSCSGSHHKKHMLATPAIEEAAPQHTHDQQIAQAQ